VQFWVLKKNAVVECEEWDKEQQVQLCLVTPQIAYCRVCMPRESLAEVMAPQPGISFILMTTIWLAM